MGLTFGRKLGKSLASRSKSPHPIETLLAGFHVGPLSRSNFILEFRNAVFFKGRETGELRDLEKDPGTEAKTNNKLYPHVHVAPGQNRTVAIGGNGRRRALSQPDNPYPRRNVFIILLAFSSCLNVHWEKYVILCSNIRRNNNYTKKRKRTLCLSFVLSNESNIYVWISKKARFF